MTLVGFPHSEIDGSKVVGTSPSLIAANHVLHRLLTPRHSPYALSILSYTITIVFLALFSCQGARAQKVCASGLSPEYWILKDDYQQ